MNFVVFFALLNGTLLTWIGVTLVFNAAYMEKNERIEAGGFSFAIAVAFAAGVVTLVFWVKYFHDWYNALVTKKDLVIMLVLLCYMLLLSISYYKLYKNRSSLAWLAASSIAAALCIVTCLPYFRLLL